jgi:hypothetical protein
VPAIGTPYPPAERDADRDAGVTQRGERHPVALGQAGRRLGQAAECFGGPRVGPGEQDRQPVGAAAPRRVEAAVERLEVGRVRGAVRQVDVEVRRHALERVVARPVQGGDEDGRVPGEQLGVPVALVHVQVEDQHALPEPVPAERRHRDGHVVERAEPAAGAVARVVRAATERGAHAVLERRPGGRLGRADRVQGAGHERGRPRQAEARGLARSRSP